MAKYTKCIVTGGLGFIGSNTVDKLVARGDDVYVIDNMHTGNEENMNAGAKLYISGNAGAITGLASDVSDDVKTVYHFGIYSSTPMYRKDPTLVGKAISDFIEVLEFCRIHDSNLVFASTSSIYNGFDVPHIETMTPKVKDFYTEARYPMERLGELYSDMHGLSVVPLRYFSVYGPRDESKNSYANLITQYMVASLECKQFDVYGDGNQTRDFTHVYDIADANLKAAEYKKKKFNVFNVGNGDEVSINKMMDMVDEVAGTPTKRNYIINPLKNYVDRTCCETTKMRKELGFNPKIQLQKGLAMQYDYLKKRLYY